MLWLHREINSVALVLPSGFHLPGPACGSDALYGVHNGVSGARGPVSQVQESDAPKSAPDSFQHFLLAARGDVDLPDTGATS